MLIRDIFTFLTFESSSKIAANSTIGPDVDVVCFVRMAIQVGRRLIQVSLSAMSLSCNRR